MKKSDYLVLRHNYEPEQIKLIVIAESPPVSGLYFYNSIRQVSLANRCSRLLMKQLGISCMSKERGLREFQQLGWVLVDATYETVNELSDRSRNTIIERDYRVLLDDLAALTPDRLAPLMEARYRD